MLSEDIPGKDSEAWRRKMLMLSPAGPSPLEHLLKNSRKLTPEEVKDFGHQWYEQRIPEPKQPGLVLVGQEMDGKPIYHPSNSGELN